MNTQKLSDGVQVKEAYLGRLLMDLSPLDALSGEWLVRTGGVTNGIRILVANIGLRTPWITTSSSIIGY